ncbi:hypothetical protein P691DRAFT_785792 [Macrolepiota fuliginosa MF-IS2]|uniref:Uncharacterized protein n=1 Tax=Macrolepiota fuliginosa MF-IS2 TaxID=1400762 RepID=A0A9P6C510_9AGAR|nr:hypothetical protein P691DRAFT_785792 [Macrolepiota fuliginosa MF-IS2]
MEGWNEVADDHPLGRKRQVGILKIPLSDGNGCTSPSFNSSRGKDHSQIRIRDHMYLYWLCDNVFSCGVPPLHTNSTGASAEQGMGEEISTPERCIEFGKMIMPPRLLIPRRPFWIGGHHASISAMDHFETPNTVNGITPVLGMTSKGHRNSEDRSIQSEEKDESERIPERARSSISSEIITGASITKVHAQKFTPKSSRSD